MRILRLAFLYMLHLLNNLRKLNHALLSHTYTYFRGLLDRSTMEQDEGPELERERERERERIQLLQEMDMQQEQMEDNERLQGIDVEELVPEDEDEAMDEDAESDDLELEDEDVDDDNDDSDGSDGVHWPPNELDNVHYAPDLETLMDSKRLFRKGMRFKPKAPYVFQPLRLIRCQYNSRYGDSEIPEARSGHRIIASDSHLYSLGGYNPNTDVQRRDACMLFQQLWAYNFATNRWKLILSAENSNMPKELASNALVIYNNVLISHGGTGYPFGETCSNDCYVYTTGEKPQVLQLKVTGDLPTALYGPGVVIHNDYLYTIGGTTGFDYSCDVYRLNLSTKVWENVYICRPEMRDDPEGRYRHEVVYDGHHIFVLGGGTAHTVYDLQRIPAFNLKTNQWDYFDTLPDRTVASEQDPGFPKARKCLTCVQHTDSNGNIEAFIAGGLQGDFLTYFNDIWKLNLRTKQWRKIQTATLPRPLYFHSAAQAGNGCMYIFGGIEYNENEMRRRNDLFKMWMTIPKLGDICWEAVTHYNSNLHKYDRSTLLKAGIPERFVNRLPPLPQRMSQHSSEDPSPSQFLRAVIKRMRSSDD